MHRFIDAQRGVYSTALAEIKQGKKRSHWMWYIFPQIQGLGFSATSKHYAIKDRKEAIDYMQHPVLGQRLEEISAALLPLENTSAAEIFGSPDDMKLQSSMTLFATLPGSSAVFQAVLDRYFNGEKDENTVSILAKLKS